MARREEILDAALESLGAGGQASIEDVRKRSGASVGSIYHHFGDKEGILATLYVEILRGYQEGVLLTLEDAADAESGVRGLVRFHLHWVERNPELARFLLRGGVAREGAGEELEALNQGMYGALGDWVERQSAIRPMRLEVFYVAVLGPAQELCRTWLAGRIKSVTGLDDDLAEAAWRAVRSDDPALSGNA